MAVTILGTFTGSNSFNFLPGPWGGCYHVPHFTDEEIQAQSLGDLPKVMQPESAWAELKPRWAVPIAPTLGHSFQLIYWISKKNVYIYIF